MKIVTIVFALFFPFLLYAHPGNTDSSGCHTCRTNCPNWGLSYGEYHCHSAKSSYQPEAPIRSSYGAGGTGSTQYWPDYEYSKPSCPSNSSFDSSSQNCKCNYGYVAKGSVCISGSSYCSSEIGLMSTYNASSRKCECMIGYEYDGSGCVYKKTKSTSSYTSYTSGASNSSKQKETTSTKTKVETCDSDTIMFNGRCMNQATYCSKKYGNEYFYDSFQKSCASCPTQTKYDSNTGKCTDLTSQEKDMNKLIQDQAEARLNRKNR